MTRSQIKAAVILGVLLLMLGLGWSCAKRDSSGANARQTIKAQARAAKQVERSVEISKDTQRKVERQGEATRQRTERAMERVDAVIEANPVRSGPADAASLRESREAYQRALCAHSRVLGESACAEAATAP